MSEMAARPRFRPAAAIPGESLDAQLVYLVNLIERTEQSVACLAALFAGSYDVGKLARVSVANGTGADTVAGEQLVRNLAEREARIEEWQRADASRTE